MIESRLMSRLEPNGKNDGSVQGERYFDCKPKYGVFVRPSQVQIVEAPTPVSWGVDRNVKPANDSLDRLLLDLRLRLQDQE